MTASAAPMPTLSRSLAPTVAGLWPLIVLIAAATVWFHLSGPLGPDVSWLITVSERILQGQVLYVDILEPNPPVAGYLYMPAVLLAHWLGLPAEPLVVFQTVVFAIATTGYATALVAKAGLLKRVDVLWPVTLLLFGSGWGEDFAQREHYAALAALPLMVVIAIRATGGRPTLAAWLVAGLCGGFMLAIKPHFALAILLPVLYAGIRQRSIRPILAPELWLAGVLFLAFVALIWFGYPAFFTNILPVATAVYIPDRRTLWELLSVRAPVLFAAVLLVALLGFRREFKTNALLGVLFAAAIGFALSYLAQGKGYAYQLMPGVAMLATYVIMSFAERGGDRASLLDRAVPLLAAAVLAVMPMLDDVAQWKKREPLQEALLPYGPGLRIANVTPDLTATSPLHRVLHAELINAPPGLLMSISAYRLRTQTHPDAAALAKIDAFEAAERVRLREDIKRRPPDILVTTSDGYNWLAWAEKDGELAALLALFEDIGDVPFDGYKLRLMKRPGLSPRP